MVTRDTIIDHAAKLAQQEAVSEITVVRLARELGVVPGLIRYFVGSREALLSAVFNRALKERADTFPALTGDWRADVEAHIRHQHALQVKWKGMTTYAAEHNRNRLFQTVAPGETDYGLVFVERMSNILRKGGFSAPQAAIAFQLLMMLTLAVATGHVRRQQPSEHRQFLLDLTSRLDARRDAGARFLLPAFAEVDSAATLDTGLKLMLDGFAGWLPARKPARKQATARKKSPSHTPKEPR